MKINEKTNTETSAQKTQATQSAASTSNTTPAAQAAPAVVVPSKREAALKAVMDGIKARNLGVAHPKFVNVEEGSNLTLLPENDKNVNPWPSIRIGKNGGIDVIEVRSWNATTTTALEVAINGDLFLKKQSERDARRAAAAAAPKKPAAPVTTGEQVAA